MEILNILDDHFRLCLGSDTLPCLRPATSITASAKPLAPMAIRPACSATTVRFSPAATAAPAESPSKSPCMPAASTFATAAPIIHRPAARSNASTKPSKNGCTHQSRPHRGPTPSPARHLPRLLRHRAPTPRARPPHPTPGHLADLNHPDRHPTAPGPTASATAASRATASSPCATTAAYTTSGWAADTPALTSWS